MRSSLEDLTSTIATLMPLFQQMAQHLAAPAQPPVMHHEMLERLNEAISKRLATPLLDRPQSIEAVLTPITQIISTVESMDSRLRAIEKALPRRSSGEIRLLASEKRLEEVLVVVTGIQQSKT